MTLLQKLLHTTSNALHALPEPISNDFDQARSELIAGCFSPNIRTIIDVGAHIGEFASIAHEVLPHAKIIAFEPQEQAADAFRERMGKSASLHPFAIGDHDGIVTLYENAFTPCTTCAEMTPRGFLGFPYSLRSRKKIVPIHTLDSVMSDNMLTDDVFLKIDVNGYEDHVLRGATRLLRRVKYVFIEVSFQPLYRDHMLFPELRTMLEGAGLTLRGFRGDMLHFFTKQRMQSDALFVRESPQPRP